MQPRHSSPHALDRAQFEGQIDEFFLQPHVGGVIPPQDWDELYAAGATAIFPPGTVISEAAEKLLAKLNERAGYGPKAV